MGHFSRFIEPGSVRVSTKFDGITTLECIAFITPGKSCVLVVLNRESKAAVLQIAEESIGNFIHEIPPRSIQTFKWKSR